MKTNLVVGCGVSGATIARNLAEALNEKVIIIDAKDHIAGNCYDYRDENGIMIHKYGSHIFHTQSEEVWNFISRFTQFNTYMHKVIAMIDGIETTIPFNLRTLYDCFPPSLASQLETKLLEKFKYNTKVPILEFAKQNDTELKFLADYVYEKVFLHYTTKQWGCSPKDGDGSVTARVPVYISCDKRYFQDKYQGIPLEGYTKAIERMLTHPNIEIKLNTPFKNFKGHFDRIFYTGSIDEFFNYKFGELPYRSVHFKLETHPTSFYQSNAVVNYPCNYDFTRIHEYKYYLHDSSDKTVIAKEFSENYIRGKNDPYYPIPNKENITIYNLYLNEASKHKNLYFLGRLGNYKYYDMDKAIAYALNLIKTLN